MLCSHLTQAAPMRDVWGDNVSPSPSLRKVSYVGNRSRKIALVNRSA
jgi:hypothetical protein